jgi:hypothetical protein
LIVCYQNGNNCVQGNDQPFFWGLWVLVNTIIPKKKGVIAFSMQKSREIQLNSVLQYKT